MKTKNLTKKTKEQNLEKRLNENKADKKKIDAFDFSPYSLPFMVENNCTDYGFYQEVRVTNPYTMFQKDRYSEGGKTVK